MSDEMLPLEGLDPFIQERVTPVGHPLPPGPLGALGAQPGRCVIYWMRTAMRAHENPALDLAAHLANALEVPLVVYQELRAQAPYACDRFHWFFLQGARDVQEELAGRQIAYGLQLERRGEAFVPLEVLAAAAQAAAVVVEDLPTHAHCEASLALARALGPGCLVWAVDTACLVPARAVPGVHDRMFRFRQAMAPLLAARLLRSWTPVTPLHSGDARAILVGGHLPELALLEVAHADLAEEIARCEIDHGVGRAHQSPGGSAAGYARWRAFRDGHLGRYHLERNDAARPWAVSRLSAYLHHGQVSPFRIAAQAARHESEGARKFIDELLGWREFAHHVCLHQRGPLTLDWLPDWARRTLEAHAGDPRPRVLDWERLSEGESGEELWDLCQKSLAGHGELHNNLRMTWGKQLLEWTASPGQALALAVDLNDRHALDGQDPNSYLGLGWCLGLADRPFDPPGPVLGSVRPRPLAEHARRLNRAAYGAQILGGPGRLRVAVIGAGIAGLSCARVLASHHVAVEVFDKGRGFGGRASTRQMASDGHAELHFDHGAQYFTARHGLFARHLEAWQARGVVAPWAVRPAVLDATGLHRGADEGAAPGVGRYVGVPGMNALVRHLGRGLVVQFGQQVTRLVAGHVGGWQLFGRQGAQGPESLLGHYDAVVLGLVPPQAAALLEAHDAAMARRLEEVAFDPVWAVMAAFAKPLELGMDACFVNEGPLSWVARNASKPQRASAPDTWVLHASAGWTRAHLEDCPQQVASALLQAFTQCFGLGQQSLVGVPVAHRWRYARAQAPLEDGAWMVPSMPGVVLCGDWLSGSRVEGAWLSGRAAAGRLLGTHDPSGPAARKAGTQPGQGSLF